MTHGKVRNSGKLWGITQIARAIGISPRRAKTLAELPGAPIYKPDARRYFAERHELITWYGQWCLQHELDRQHSKAVRRSVPTDTKGVRGVKGVPGGYTARISLNRKQVSLGTYDTKEEAAAAYRGAYNIVRRKQANA